MRRAAVSLFAVSLLALGACSESAKSKAGGAVDDLIEQLRLPQNEADCLKAKVRGYTDAELEQIEKDNRPLNTADLTDDVVREQMSDELRQFVDDISSCLGSATTSG